MAQLDREVALLQSPDAAGLLRAALTGAADLALDGFEAELTSWQYRPGAEVTAGYRVSYDPDGVGPVEEHLFVTSAAVGPPAVTVSRDHLRFDVWRHPSDPRLPALATACDPQAVLGWVRAEGEPLPDAFDLTLLGYRPLRRAVLRATADDRCYYVKVLRPERAHRLVQRQDLLAGAGLTPPILARPAAGVLLTAAAPGAPLSTRLAGPPAGLPSSEDLIDALDRLPAQVCDLARRPSWADRLDFHAATARDRLPEESARIDRVLAELDQMLAEAPTGPVRPTHGDFYEANIMVDERGRISLIDLDSVGPGLREDDLACLLAHLSVLPALSPQHYAGVASVVEGWTRDFERAVHPVALGARTAAVVLSLVAGADGDQALTRLDLTEQWAARAMAGV